MFQTVAEIVEEGRILETVQKNREFMKSSRVPTEVAEVNQVMKNKTKNVCYRCGDDEHYANDKNCPAKNKKCNECGLIGHFKMMCKTKKKGREAANKKRPKKKVLQIQEDSESSDYRSEGDNESDVQHIYAVRVDHDVVTCYTGGVKLNWVVDSGAQVNVVSRSTWKQLKNQGCVAAPVKNARKCLRVYGNGKIAVHKVIETKIATRKKSVNHQIFVVDTDQGASLLSKKTSIDLGILEIHGDLLTVENTKEVDAIQDPSTPKNPTIGKIKNLQVQIKIDSAVTV